MYDTRRIRKWCFALALVTIPTCTLLWIGRLVINRRAGKGILEQHPEYAYTPTVVSNSSQQSERGFNWDGLRWMIQYLTNTMEITHDTSDTYIKLGGSFAGITEDIYPVFYDFQRLAKIGPGLVAGVQMLENTTTDDPFSTEAARVVGAVAKDAAVDAFAAELAVGASVVGTPVAGAAVYVTCQLGCEKAVEALATEISENVHPYINPWNWYTSLVNQIPSFP